MGRERAFGNVECLILNVELKSKSVAYGKGNGKW